MPGIRSFIALPTSPDVRERMSAIQGLLKVPQANVKWESPDKFHITLKFLGSVEQSKIELISAALSSCVRSVPSFDLVYDSLGAFPTHSNPRVVWIGIRPNRAVLDLQTAVEQICMRFGFPKEDRAFHPHITFGRVKGKLNLVRLTEAIKTITFEPIETRCPEILLIKSDLRPGGSVYTILKSFPLQL